MKKKGLLVILFALVCLLTFGCGKDEEKDTKKESSNIPEKEMVDTSKRTLTCKMTRDADSEEIVVVQDIKSSKIIEASMTLTTDISNYGEPLTEEKLQKMACTDPDNELDSCTAKLNGDFSTIKMVYNVEKFTEEIKDELKIKVIDATTLPELKSYLEKGMGGDISCSIS